MKKILIDLTFILNVKDLNKSTSIYVQRFLDNLDLSHLNNYEIVVLLRKLVYEYFYNKYSSKVEFVIFSESKIKISFLRSLSDALRWRKQVNLIDCDVVYVPFTWIYNSLKINKRKVITIHDLKPVKETSKRVFKVLVLFMFKLFYKIAIKNADSIIAITDYVRKDILKTFKTDKIIEVVYNGVPLNSNICSVDILINKKYILYVNTITKYKNLETLIKAFNIISNRNNDLYLVVVGKETTYWNDICLPLISQNDKVIRLNFVIDEQLNWLYKNSLTFVTTSTREGFGYTPIEAGLHGCPVVSTRCEALPESTMNMVEYYDSPFNEKELSEKIEYIINNCTKEEFKIKIRNTQKAFFDRYDIKKSSENIFSIIIGKDE